MSTDPHSAFWGLPTRMRYSLRCRPFCALRSSCWNARPNGSSKASDRPAPAMVSCFRECPGINFCRNFRLHASSVRPACLNHTQSDIRAARHRNRAQTPTSGAEKNAPNRFFFYESFPRDPEGSGALLRHERRQWVAQFDEFQNFRISEFIYGEQHTPQEATLSSKGVPQAQQLWAPVANAKARQCTPPAYAHATREHKLIRSGSSFGCHYERRPSAPLGFRGRAPAARLDLR